MSSGVKVSDDCIKEFENIKLKHTYSYIIYRISDERNIIVDEIGGLDKTYDDFRNRMKCAQDKGECRYAVFDMKYELPNKQRRDKLLFIHWSPDNITTRQKMLYASSLRALIRKLDGVAVEIQANDEDELNLSSVLERCH